MNDFELEAAMHKDGLSKTISSVALSVWLAKVADQPDGGDQLFQFFEEFPSMYNFDHAHWNLEDNTNNEDEQ